MFQEWNVWNILVQEFSFLKHKKTAFIVSFFSHVADKNRRGWARGVSYSKNKRTFLDRESLLRLHVGIEYMYQIHYPNATEHKMHQESDAKRRDNYHSRMGRFKDAQKYSPGYLSLVLLW